MLGNTNLLSLPLRAPDFYFPAGHCLGCYQNLCDLNCNSLIPQSILWSESPSVMSDSLRPCGPYTPWSSSGQNTGVGRLSLLHGVFPTQGSNWGLLHCRRTLYQLSCQGNPICRKIQSVGKDQASQDGGGQALTPQPLALAARLVNNDYVMAKHVCSTAHACHDEPARPRGRVCSARLYKLHLQRPWGCIMAASAGSITRGENTAFCCYGCSARQKRVNVCSSLSFLPASLLVPCLPWVQWTVRYSKTTSFQDTNSKLSEKVSQLQKSYNSVTCSYSSSLSSTSTPISLLFFFSWSPILPPNLEAPFFSLHPQAPSFNQLKLNV